MNAVENTLGGHRELRCAAKSGSPQTFAHPDIASRVSGLAILINPAPVTHNTGPQFGLEQVGTFTFNQLRLAGLLLMLAQKLIVIQILYNNHTIYSLPL